VQRYSGYNADKEYLRILYLAATTMESEVETALVLLMETEAMFSSDHVKELVCSKRQPVPALAVPQVNLDEYNVLLDIKKVAP
jgi:predicted transcriptional regulator